MQFRTQNQISSSQVFGTLPLSPWEENATSFYLLSIFTPFLAAAKLFRFKDELFEKLLIQTPAHSVGSSPHVSLSFLLLRWGDILKWFLPINCCNHFWELFKISCFSIPTPPPSVFWFPELSLKPVKPGDTEVIPRLSACGYSRLQLLLRNETRISLPLIRDRIITEI